jgi:HEAT repeat protein
MRNNIDELIADFICDDVIKCQKARRSLVSMGSKAVPYLIRGLSNDRHWVRWESAKALGQIGDDSATLALVKSLEDKEFDVRWLAAEALINIGHNSLIPLLEALADHGDKSIWLRRGAHHVLHDIDRGEFDNILKTVMSELDNSGPSVEILYIAQKALDDMKKGKGTSVYLE